MNFNTSHVNVNPKCPEFTYNYGFNFNTSHVNVNPRRVAAIEYLFPSFQYISC